jgi:Arc/MetJ-type ribon-helix-helix transcriptional regulator
MPRLKQAGRPPGSANNKSQYVRDETCNIRCSTGFNKVVELLKDEGNYTSKADVIHEALRYFALSKKLDEKTLFWIKQIL